MAPIQAQAVVLPAESISLISRMEVTAVPEPVAILLSKKPMTVPREEVRNFPSRPSNLDHSSTAARTYAALTNEMPSSLAVTRMLSDAPRAGMEDKIDSVLVGLAALNRTVDELAQTLDTKLEVVNARLEGM